MENSESTVKKRKRSTEEVDKKKKKTTTTTPTSSSTKTESKRKNKEEVIVTPKKEVTNGLKDFLIFVNPDQVSISGKTFGLILGTSKEEAMEAVRIKMAIYGIELDKEAEDGYRQVGAVSSIKKAFVIVGDLL